MVRAIDEASRAASQLLDHAMITFRSDKLQKELINLNTLVQNLIINFEPIANMKDIELKFIQISSVEINGDFILEDLDNDLSKVDLDNLKLVFKDLSKRKYGFQYKSVPLAHTEFMIELKKELDNRC